MSVVILNYNGLRHLRTCINSVLNQTYRNFEVIVVDNCSDDGSAEFLAKNFPEINVIMNKSNLGFAKGNNIGATAAKGDYIAFLNNDTEAYPNWLEELVKSITKNESIMACSSKMLMFNKRNVINSAGGGLNLLMYGWDIGLYEEDEGQYDSERYIPFACAGAMIIRKEVLNRLGLFDEKYFIYGEDVDLGVRLNLAGYKVLYVPTAIVYHKYGATVGPGSLKKRYLGERNTMRTLLKNLESKNVLRFLPILIFHYVTSVAFSLRLNTLSRTEKINVLWIYVKALLWNLAYLPDTLRERFTVQRQRLVSDERFFEIVYCSFDFPFILTPDYRPKVLSEIIDPKEVDTGKIFMGVNDKTSLGYGWHNLEFFASSPRERYNMLSLPYRWTTKSAYFYFHAKRCGDYALLIKSFLPSFLVGKTYARISINGVCIGKIFPGRKPRFFELMFKSEAAEIIEGRIDVVNSWKPHDYLRNNDLRELGIGVQSLEIRELYSAVVERSRPTVSLVIPNKNGGDRVLNTLRSIHRQSYDNILETIVADDGSPNEELELIEKYSNEIGLNVRIVRKTGLGPSGLKNCGALNSGGELLAFLDNDVVLEPDWLENAVSALSSGCRIGMVAGKILLDGFPRTLNGCGSTATFLGYGFDRGFYETDVGQFDTVRDSECLSPCTAACLVRREVLHVIGLFDERFFYPFEDVDFGWRANLYGYKVAYTPKARVAHVRGATVKKRFSPSHVKYLAERNRLRMVLKNYGNGSLRKILIPLILSYVVPIISAFLSRRQSSADRVCPIMVYSKSIMWNLSRFGSTCRERVRTQNTRRVSDRQIFDLMELWCYPTICFPDYEVFSKRIGKGESLHSEFVAGVNERGLSYGWHGLEQSSDPRFKFCRWCSYESCLYLSCPIVPGSRGRDGSSHEKRALLIQGPTTFLPGPMSFTVLFNGHRLSRVDSVKSSSTVFAIPAKCMKELNEIVIRVPKSHIWTPDDFFSNNDYRKLGIAVSSISIVPMFPSEKSLRR